MRILFMGTSDFAVESLNALVESGYAPCAVISQPDKPKGRGYTMTPTPVSARAEELNIPVYKPVTLKDGAIEDLLKEINPELNVVVAYGKILPAYVLDYPKFGSVNVHGSLLPMYRGAAPINHAIMDGCKVTGVTTMYMDEGLDTGDMIFKAETEITENDNFGTLHDRCALMGGKLLVKTVEAIEKGEAPRIKQEGETCYAHMIDKEVRRLSFDMTAKDFVNRVKGLAPAPCAFCFMGGKNLKIYNAEVSSEKSSAENGTVISKDKLIVKVSDGSVEITELQLEGKKRMSAEDFCRGRHIDKLD